MEKLPDRSPNRYVIVTGVEASSTSCAEQTAPERPCGQEANDKI